MKRFLLLLPLALFSCTRQAPPDAPAGGTAVPREQWADTMVTALPTILCRPEGFFRACFQLDESACLGHAMRATRSCLMKLEPDLPSSLQQPKDGEAGGAKLGLCTGPTLEAALGGQKVNSPKCNDPGQWKE